MRALVLSILLFGSVASADAPAIDPVAALPPGVGKLVVGTVPVAPFIIKNPDGTWGGISMDLWKEVARRLHLEVRRFKVAAQKSGLLPSDDLGVSKVSFRGRSPSPPKLLFQRNLRVRDEYVVVKVDHARWDLQEVSGSGIKQASAKPSVGCSPI